MKAKIVFTARIWSEIENFFFPDGQNLRKEKAGFAVCGISKSRNQLELLVREFIPLDSSGIDKNTEVGIQVKPEKVIELINKSYPRGFCLLEIHSHPWKGKASFSSLDERGTAEMVNYLFPQFPESPYAAIALTFNSLTAQVWYKKNKIETKLKNFSKEDIVFQKNSKNRRFDRQKTFFGDKVQGLIENLTVGIVGLGGTGSHISQQLAYLGINNFVLIDPDKVELSNLNRLVGASEKDLRKEKVEVIKRHIQFINCKAKVIRIPRPVYEKESIVALKEVDFLFGCVDNDAARVIINNISMAYLIPYIDLGSDINLLPNGSVESAGGRVFCVHPDGPCLLCSEGEINQEEVKNELSSRKVLMENVSRGYAQNRISRPAIISVNGLISSQAVTEFIYFIMGITRPVKFWYEIHGKLMQFTSIKKKEGCIHCVGSFGLGDLAHIEEYGRNKKTKK